MFNYVIKKILKLYKIFLEKHRNEYKKNHFTNLKHSMKISNNHRTNLIFYETPKHILRFLLHILICETFK